MTIFPRGMHDNYEVCLNLANSNCRQLLSLLGFEADDCGTLDPIEVRDAIDRIKPNKDAADCHNRWLQEVGIGFTGGPGYWDSRLIALRAIAEYAIHHNKELVYG